MKFILLPLLLGIGILHGSDIAHVSIDREKKLKLNPRETDLVRENLIHIFDSSIFHQTEGGQLPVRTEEEIKELIQKISLGSHIEFILNEPARIVVENKTLYMKKMWVSIRESDGFVYDWTFETPDGKLIALGKARGDLVVSFAPFILNLLNQSKPADDTNG